MLAWAIRHNHELGEVVRHVGTLELGVLAQVLEDGVRCRTVYVDFFEHGELNVTAICKFPDLLRGPGLLTCELVARESQDLQALFRILLIYLNQLFIVRRCLAAFGCYVYAQIHLGLSRYVGA